MMNYWDHLRDLANRLEEGFGGENKEGIWLHVAMELTRMCTHLVGDVILSREKAA